MTNFFIRALNAPALILIIILGVAIQTALFNSYPLMYLQPDIVLITVIWCALKRNFYEGGVLTLIMGNIAEIHSGSPQGSLLLSYMIIFLLIRWLNNYLLLNTLTSLVGLTLFASIMVKLSQLGVLHLLELSENQWRHTIALLFPSAVMQGIISTWVFKWYERFDWITYKNPDAEKMTGDEYMLEEEGL